MRLTSLLGEVGPNTNALLLTQAMFRKADRLCERSLAMQEKLLGPEHPDVAATLTNRARLMVKEVRRCLG